MIDADRNEALQDLATHKRAWRKALEMARDSAEVIPPDIDDRSYWEHEIKAFDRTMDALASDDPTPELPAPGCS